MERFLITGQAGFIGLHTANFIGDKGHFVAGLDNFSTSSKDTDGKVSVKRPNYVFEELDLCNFRKSLSFIRKQKPDYIIHLAAIPSVGRSVENPRKSIRNNVLSTMNICEIARILKVKKLVYAGSSSYYGGKQRDRASTEGYWPPLCKSPYAASKAAGEMIVNSYHHTYKLPTVVLRFFNCYDKETEVLTEDGFKYFKDITFDDKIATLNPDSNCLEYHNPDAIQKFKYTGDLYHFKNKRIDFKITLDHSLYLSNQLKKGSNFRLVKLDEILNHKSNYSYKLKQDCLWDGKDLDYEIIPDTPHEDGRLSKANFEKRIPIILWLRFLGWFLSEGSVFSGTTVDKYGRENRYYRVNLTQKDEDNKNDMVEILEEMGYNPYVHLNKRGLYNINVSSKQLYLHLKQFENEKFIPKYIKELKTIYLQVLTTNLMKGDGHKNDEKYSTKYSKFADDFQEVLLKIGKVGHVVKEYKGDFPIHRVYINNRYNPRIGDPRTKKLLYHKDFYDDFVYDVTVPNHIIFVRRSGKVCWNGNCFGPWQNPHSQYSAVVPTFIMKLLDREKPIIYGNGLQSRDFTYVENVCLAIYLACLDTKYQNVGETFDVGCSASTTLTDLLEMLYTILGYRIDPVFEKARAGDVAYSLADIWRIRYAIDYKPTVLLEEGLKRTVAYYKSFKETCNVTERR